MHHLVLVYTRVKCSNFCPIFELGGALGSWLAPLPFTPEFGVWFPVSAVWKKQKMFLPHPRVKVSIVGSLRDREVACSASDRQGSNFESCISRTVSSQSYHLQGVLLAQFSLYVHKGGLKPDSFYFIFQSSSLRGVVGFLSFGVASRLFSYHPSKHETLTQCQIYINSTSYIFNSR